jgi:hypothetical protein
MEEKINIDLILEIINLDEEVKVVWREDPNLDKPPKVGRGLIKGTDDNFVYLSGQKGTVIVNKKDIIAIKQLPPPPKEAE